MKKISLLVLLILFTFYGCKNYKTGNDSLTSIDKNIDPTNGVELYNNYCESCHNILNNTDIPNRTAKGTALAIVANAGDNTKGYMGNLSGLLNGIEPGATLIAIEPALINNIKTPYDGTELYKDYCENCHLALSQTTKPKRSSIVLNYANNNVPEMAFLKNTLHQSAITAIVDILALENFNDSNLNGKELYSYYCAGCHNSLENSSKKNRDATSIAISNLAINEMLFLKDLSTTQLSSLETALADPSFIITGGAALYAEYCSACHFEVKDTNIRDPSSDIITSAITNNIGGMQALETLLTASEIIEISDLLSGK